MKGLYRWIWGYGWFILVVLKSSICLHDWIIIRILVLHKVKKKLPRCVGVSSGVGILMKSWQTLEGFCPAVAAVLVDSRKACESKMHSGCILVWMNLAITKNSYKSSDSFAPKSSNNYETLWQHIVKQFNRCAKRNRKPSSYRQPRCCICFLFCETIATDALWTSLWSIVRLCQPADNCNWYCANCPLLLLYTAVVAE